jgi:hypothetical protein
LTAGTARLQVSFTLSGKIMNQKSFKIYWYPLIVIISSILPWWAFSKYLLKWDFIQFWASSTNSNETITLLFFLIVLSMIYLSWVLLNMWLEIAMTNAEKEKKIEIFFKNYGKTFVGIVITQFVAVVILIIIVL